MGAEAERKNEYSSDRLRKRKNPHHEDAILEGGRSNNLEMVDTVFLNCGQGESPLCETLQSETIKNVQHGQSKGGKW
ncbi:scarecrow-like protein 14 [Pyrus ussuriensis x Pyrus communis]|uniref:Scarecrow-like protein 14 n=1 Tax=Pyrus ussuriensis x Pyrus communis TaxID=2448454 RepID=A0A5N5G2W7_9ROSA|nr:scarecrow-like protein 14 [Pyrus ussuriensis x Pyrus communis]